MDNNGLVFLIVVISNAVAQAGLAAYFPWTIPALFISNVPLGFASIAILTITGIIGFEEQSHGGGLPNSNRFNQAFA